MAFWGVEVKPGKPFRHLPYGIKGRLHVSQATLGIGSTRNKKSILQCTIGKKGSPVFLCCLWPDKCESSQLNVEFDESREVVFSVIGPTSVHITGFFVKDRSAFLLQYTPPETSEERPCGEDIGDSSSEYNRSQDDDDEDEDDSFIVPDSPCSNDQKAAGKLQEQGKAAGEEDVIRKRKRGGIIVSDEEEQGGEINNNIAQKGQLNENVVVSESDTSDDVNTFFMSPSSSNLLLQKKPSSFAPIINNDLSSKELAAAGGLDHVAVAIASSNTTTIMKPKHHHNNNNDVCNNKIIIDTRATATAVEEECKKKKKRKEISKVMSSDIDEKNDHRMINNTPTDKGHSQNKAQAAPLPSITPPNGLLIEDIQVGQPDAKVALPGKKVSVYFTGRIKENEDQVFDSNVGGKPLKFHLGSGEMGGWDDGIIGMRVGGKRRLTIPPSLWKKSKHHQDKQIRSKASLVYEIQLLRVR